MQKNVLDQFSSSIQLAYDQKSEVILEKETDTIFKNLFFCILTLFSDKVSSIKVDPKPFILPKEYLFSDKHKKNLNKWVQRLKDIDDFHSELEFGKLKIDFEYWYYELGGESIQFVYQEDYLLTPQAAADALGISKVTLNKYVKQGLEYIDNQTHKRIPKYAIEIMKDPIYSIRMQQIAQSKKLRQQTPEDRYHEVIQELADLQLKYGTQTVQEAFSEYNGDNMDDPTDYYRWKDLQEEMTDILGWRGGKKDQ
ncbi:helix-turn-helix domain-containing protein [Paenibacillus sp. PsM32]|uniref:helix-turn-helix domain-containing protein n=1 Tax=Paenibacillus sp. PsM32 TaxID=3030536 RepID=UPI00263B91CF|nr:helix-turn-helix domain-containing protein [Paenibacillus sp. PsM32]MDN4617262.1 helix-turn-helix domain-containing protein [Paenibacillus sp. PsM32]